jgi:tetratricopeptide (TPR) repeat protein
LHTEREDWGAVILDAKRILAVNPLIPEPHRVLAEAGERSGNRDAAIRGLRTLTLMVPFDPADVHFRAARMLEQSGRLEEARKQVLLALEEAPRYREAHELLLAVLDELYQPRIPDPPPLPEDIE